MSIVAPAITEGLDTYKSEVERYQGFAERVHIDVCDGEFSPTFTVMPQQLWWPQTWVVDLHMMVARPSEHVQKLIELMPHLVILHSEVNEDLVPTVRQLKAAGIKVGVALLRSTVPSSAEQAILEADHVMIFSGELGRHGGIASMMQLEKVRLIRDIKANVEIGWDGGITKENSYSIAQGGVDVLNVGGALSNAEDPQSVYATLINETNKRGII